MIGIRAISSHIPDDHLDNLKQANRFGETADFINEKIGALSLPILSGGLETSDLAVKAIRNLSEEHGLDLNLIQALIVISQNPDGHGLPHTSAIVQAKLGMPSKVAAFDISLGCSGYVYGLSILRGFMAEVGLSEGVLVTADPYSKVIDREDRVTSLLFGDAATATWISQGASWYFRKPLMETDGTGAKNLYVDPSKKLLMNGRQVFNFAASRVPQQIDQFLAREGLAVSEIDLFCLHQGSKAIIDAISRRYPSVRERFVKDILTTGNTVSSSIPLLLEKHVLNQTINRVLISGFGVGLSWATNLIERR